MPMVRCTTNKHIYNSEVHDNCPYCTIIVDSPASLNIDEYTSEGLSSTDSGFKTQVVETPSTEDNITQRTEKVNVEANPNTQRIYLNEPTVKLDNETSPISESSAETDKKDATNNMDTTDKPKHNPAAPMKTQVFGFEKVETNNNKEPISQKNAKLTQLPVTGWLVIIEGQGIGSDFRLIQGENRIGRDNSMEVCLDFGEDSDDMVSRDSHAIVVYDNMSNIFFVERGRSRNLPLLNGATIRTGEDVKSGDIIQVGKTKLMMVSFCNETFKW